MSSILRRIIHDSGFLRNTYTGCSCHMTKRHMIMDDDGDTNIMQTSVNFINDGQRSTIFFDSYSTEGFRMSSGIRVIGPVAVFPRSVLHWSISGVEDVNRKSLSLFTILNPKIDILIIGVGEKENMSKIQPDLHMYLQSKRINVEILPTDQALATFNFLNSENRFVAGAFIPPSFVLSSVDEILPSEKPLTHGILENEDSNMTFGDLVKATKQLTGELSDARQDYVQGRISKEFGNNTPQSWQDLRKKCKPK